MEDRFYTQAYRLAIFTIVYNLIEGFISVWFGFNDKTLALFGFGIDSFIEVVSGLGILQMIIRIKLNANTSRNSFEVKALQITGYGFYLLSIGLLIGALLNFYQHRKPDTTFWGIVVSVISIVVMTWLYKSKIYYGNKLNSKPIIADGRCTLVCIYMSLVLLGASLIYQLTGFIWADAIGAIGLAWFSYSEGKESLEKAKGIECCCEDENGK